MAPKRAPPPPPRTVEDLESKVRAWKAALGAKRLRDVAPEDLEALLARPSGSGEARAASTRQQERSCFQWFFSWAVRKKLLRESPAVAVAPVKVPRKAIRWLEEEEEARLLEAAAEHIRGIVILAIETGLRRRALLGLLWAHVDLEEGMASAPGGVDEGRERFPGAALAAGARGPPRPAGDPARDPPEGPRLPRGRALPALAALSPRRSRGRSQRLKFHDMRRTFLTRARARGVPLEVAMALSDHQDIRTALRVYRGIPSQGAPRGRGAWSMFRKKLDSKWTHGPSGAPLPATGKALSGHEKTPAFTGVLAGAEDRS